MLSTLSLNGCQNKFTLKGYVYKEDKFGYESISEALISELESYIKGLNYLDYELVYINNMCCCRSKYMLNEGEKLYSIYDIISSVDGDHYLEKYSGLDLKKYVLSRVYDLVYLDIDDYLSKIVYLDCITLNSDRHLGNISLIKSNSGYRLAPIFDNGLGLLSDLSKYSLEQRYSKYINDVRSRPFHTNFSIQRSYFNCNPLVINIEGFLHKIELVEKNKGVVIPFKVECYDRALKVLFRRLKDLKDDVWVVSK